MTQTPMISEADILADVIGPDEGNLPRDVARALLEWHFNDRASRRMSELANKNNKGTITDTEREELDRYVRVGSFINVVQAKARVSLKDIERSS